MTESAVCSKHVLDAILAGRDNVARLNERLDGRLERFWPAGTLDQRGFDENFGLPNVVSLACCCAAGRQWFCIRRFGQDVEPGDLDDLVMVQILRILPRELENFADLHGPAHDRKIARLRTVASVAAIAVVGQNKWVHGVVVLDHAEPVPRCDVPVIGEAGHELNRLLLGT